ncbi:MAG: peptidylprolyl isomerase [Chitinophagales bacterium]|nr:peptidylprolyl isomerase [Chitinophagales bacterium]
MFSHQAYSKDSKPGFLVDKVIANIDNNIILYSDIENQVHLLSKDLEDNRDSRCYLVEQLVMNKIMTSQAVLDSIPLTDDEVDSELDRKINYYISMLGSKELFEQYYDKPIEVIKEDFRDDIRDQMLAQRMRDKIVEGLTVTPTEVRDYYNKIPKDSLPFFNTEYEVSQIVFKVGVGEDQQKQAFDKILDLKKRIEDGEDFALLATLYSDDPGSAAEGGELGLMPRGSFVPEFEAAAFKLKDGEVSDIVKTQFGYHLIKLNKRIGEQIDCSHILIRAQSTNNDILKTQNKADSVRNEIVKGNLNFFDAVKEFSDDDFSKGNGGRVLNYESGSTIMEPQQMDPALFKMIESLSVDSISQVEPYQMQDGTYAFRIAKLDSKVAPHQANLAQDYSKILDTAKSEKEQRLIKDWVLKRSKKSYIFISDEYKDCPKLQSWLSNE